MSALPHDSAAWVRLFANADIPARKVSLIGLASLRERIDDVSPRQLAALVLRDPLLTARLFAHAAAHRGSRYAGDITNVDGLVLTFGLVRVIDALAAAPELEARLQRRPAALEGLFAVLLRACQAARFAAEFACHRQDHEVEEIALAAMLHDFAEMLLWCEAPDTAVEIQHRLQMDPSLQLQTVQQEVLGTALSEVQLALAQAWRLPPLLTGMMDDDRVESPRTRNVTLAVALARHSANGWDDPALADDYSAIGALLHIDALRVQHLVAPQ